MQAWLGKLRWSQQCTRHIGLKLYETNAFLIQFICKDIFLMRLGASEWTSGRTNKRAVRENCECFLPLPPWFWSVVGDAVLFFAAPIGIRPLSRGEPVVSLCFQNKRTRHQTKNLEDSVLRAKVKQQTILRQSTQTIFQRLLKTTLVDFCVVWQTICRLSRPLFFFGLWFL